MDQEQPNQHNNTNNNHTHTNINSNDSNNNTNNTNNINHGNVENTQQPHQAIQLLNQMEEEHVNDDDEWSSDEQSQQISDLDYMDSDMDSQEQQQIQAQHKISIKSMDLKVIPAILQPILNEQNLDDLAKYIKLPPSKKIAKQVCAKIIKGRDTVVQCFDCRMDQTCIICMDCFKNGDHTGHKYVAKIAGGGCCDCGDAQAWSQKGFCKAHSGKFKDFEIDSKVVQSFSKIVDGLMYIYFHMVLNEHEKQQYIHGLLGFFQKMNLDNTYYNKLTALCLCKKLPPEMSLNQQLDQHTILQNILTSSISGKYFNKWFQIFISMFSYYPFKLQILKHYIQNYSSIVNGTKSSLNHSMSISCQLITSYKIVEQYCMENNIGIGQKSNVPKNINKLINYYGMLLHDLSSLCELSQKTPYLYWKMHINSNEGILNLFTFYKIVMKSVRKQQSTKSQSQICIRYINFTQTQLNLLQTFSKILRVISNDKDLLGKVIADIWNSSKKTWKDNPQSLCIFRPLERCLALALFAYFNYSLDQIISKKNDLINFVLKISPQEFGTGCSMILNRMLKTVFFYAKSQAQPGLGQSLFQYIYMYKVYSKILSMTDILCIKVFLLLEQRKHPLAFESIIDLDRSKLNNQIYVKQKATYFTQSLKLIKVFFTNFQPQIYTSYAISPNSSIYQKQIKKLILNYFKQYKKDSEYTVPQSNIKQQLYGGILPPDCKIAENYIKNNCTINKARKSLTLNKNCLQNQQIQAYVGLNLDDFWLSINSKDPFADLIKSAQFVQSYNFQIFNLLCNQITMQSLLEIVHTLFQSVNQQNINSILPTIATFYLIMLNQKQTAEKNRQICKSLLIKFIDCIPKNTLLLLNIQSQSKMNEQINQMQRKQKLNQIKAKKLQKLQKFKKKRQNFLLKNISPSIQQQKLQKFAKIPSVNQNQMQQQCCCICRGQINENSVYIVNVSIKDHQKLLHLGSGIKCVSLNTCKHIFDMKCVQNLYKVNKMVNSITCPLCKYSGNLLFPATDKYNAKMEQELLNRVFKLLSLIKNQANFYQEAIKSFYHYVLLSTVDFERTREKKSQIYSILFKLLRKNITQKQITKLQYKLKQNKISKYFQNQLKNEQNKNKQTAFTLFFNLLANNNNQGAIQLQPQFIEELGLENKQAIKQPMPAKINKQNTKQEKLGNDNNCILFKQTINYVLGALENKEIFDNQMQDESNNIQKFIKQTFRAIVDQQARHVKLQQVDLELKNKNIHIFRDLPKNYLQLSSSKKCSACSQISTKLIMCLMCGWCGCQTCDNGFAKTHINQVHGEVGAVMIIQKGLVYYITNEKSVFAGNLYEDQWQNSIGDATNWQLFQLNKILYKQMERKICLDQIPTQNAKKNKQ